MSKGPPVPLLILMTDDGVAADWVGAVQALPAGSAVIVRARDPARRETLARTFLAIARPRNIRVLIAADAKLAMRLRADGVHWPAKALSGAPQRQKPRWLVTAAAHGPKDIVAANGKAIDAILLSPLFVPLSHGGASALGPVQWASRRKLARKPVLALGGVTDRNAARAISLGASGVALIGGWVRSYPLK
jgi:thiamine-phosphate pyrophosphorylase